MESYSKQKQNKTKLSIYLDAADYAKISNLAEVNGISSVCVIRQLIHRNVDKFAIQA